MTDLALRPAVELVGRAPHAATSARASCSSTTSRASSA